MKSLVVIIGISFLLVAFQRPRVDFSGLWRLDLKESAHLPPSYASLRSYSLKVREAQDSIHFVVLEVLRSGQEVTSKPTSRRLDGKETMIGDSLPGYTIWISARLANSGRSLLVHKRLVHRLGSVVKVSYHDEAWELRDKNMLKLSITDREEKGGATDSSTCLFRRIR